MTPNQRQLIGEIITDSSQPDWMTAARLMEAAFDWLLSSLPAEPPDRIQAMKALLDLNKALKNLNDGLSALLPRLIAKAEPGPTLEESVRELHIRLKQLAQEMNQMQKQLKPLIEAEQSLQTQAAEFEKLRQRLEQMQKLEKLAGSADELREQVQRLEERLPPGAWEAEQWETKLGGYLEKLFILSEQTSAALDEKHRKMIHIIQQREADLKRIAGELQAAQERYRTVEDDFQQRRDVLEFYLEADRIVAEALGQPASGGLNQLLDHIEHLLQQADALLKTAMEANEEARRITPIPYSGGGSG